MKPGDLRKFGNNASLTERLAYANGKIFMILSKDDMYNVSILIDGRDDSNWSEVALNYLSEPLNETEPG
jgi:hypothetical protein